ncbi:MAG TPA: hypothetical protein VF212_09350 [Longimicrobiales bacterium]
MRHLFRCALIAAFAAACASSGTAVKRSSAGGDDVILSDEIATVQAANAFELIRRLRPHFLRLSGAVSLRGDGDIVVYVDGIRQGGLASLRSIPAAGITRIERLSATDATTRLGTGHVYGAILIATRSSGY